MFKALTLKPLISTMLKNSALRGIFLEENILPPDPPVGCAITLSGDLGQTLGWSAPEIDGQRFYLSNATLVGGTGAIATTPVRALDWPSNEIRIAGTKDWQVIDYTRVDQFENEMELTLAPQLGFIASDFSKAVTVSLASVGFFDGDAADLEAQIILVSGIDYVSGASVNNTSAPSFTFFNPGDQITVGLSGAGKIRVYKNGVPIDLQYYDSEGPSSEFNLFAGVENFYLGGSYNLWFYASSDPAVTGLTLSGEIVTDGAGIVHAHPSSVRDWCGQSIIVPTWTPDSLAVVGRDSYWTDVTVEDVKYQDAALTTPAAIADPVGGLRNLSSVSPDCKLEQATTSMKMIVKDDGYVGRDWQSQRIELNDLTIDYTNGWVFAIRLGSEGLISGAYPLGGAGDLALRRATTTAVRLHLGSTANTNFVVTGGGTTLDTASTLILTVNGDKARLYVNGAQYGAEMTITATTTSYTDVACIGAINRLSNTAPHVSFNRVASLSVDGMITQEDVNILHDWLENGA